MSNRLPFTTVNFRPHPLYANQHAQTILGTMLPREFAFPDWQAAGEAREFLLPDGDRLAGMLHRHPGPFDPDRPLIVLLHGLEGSIDSHYVKGLSSKAHAIGYDSLRLNFRNCGGTEGMAKRIYTGHLIEDAQAVLEALAAEGHRNLMIMGVSLGANLLLRMLGEYGDRTPSWLKGAVAVSPPIEQLLVSEAFGHGFNRIYDWYFLMSLKRKMWAKAMAHPGDRDIMRMAVQAQKVWSLYDFDNTITAQAYGFDGAHDYYRRASSADTLGQIRVPTLIIHAQDDPFIPFRMFESRAAQIAGNPCLTTVYPERGGHVGFLEARSTRRPEPWMDEYWAENQAVRFARWVNEGDADAPLSPRAAATAHD